MFTVCCIGKCEYFYASWPGSIPPWLFGRMWCHEEELPGCLWHQTPSLPPNERSRILRDRQLLLDWMWILKKIWCLPWLPEPSSPIMWPQPPQLTCEPSGLTNLQVEPVPEIKTTPPAETSVMNKCVDLIIQAQKNMNMAQKSLQKYANLPQSLAVAIAPIASVVIK